MRKLDGFHLAHCFGPVEGRPMDKFLLLIDAPIFIAIRSLFFGED
jgi:hypothetical protein